jgi:hypothetical protein
MPFIVQSTYKTGYDAGYPGMVANGETSNRISRTVEDSAGIAFGKAAFRGADDRGCTATPAAGKFMGITIADAGVVPTLDQTTPDLYQQYATAQRRRDLRDRRRRRCRWRCRLCDERWCHHQRFDQQYRNPREVR